MKVRSSILLQARHQEDLLIYHHQGLNQQNFFFIRISMYDIEVMAEPLCLLAARQDMNAFEAFNHSICCFGLQMSLPDQISNPFSVCKLCKNLLTARQTKHIDLWCAVSKCLIKLLQNILKSLMLLETILKAYREFLWALTYFLYFV